MSVRLPTVTLLAALVLLCRCSEPPCAGASCPTGSSCRPETGRCEASRDAGLDDVGGDGGVSADAGMTDFAYTGEVDAGATPLSISEHRRFECDPSAVSVTGAVVSTLTGTTGEDLVITPTAAPCSFNLLHRSDAGDATLPSQPSGYLVTVGARFPEGVRLVCASDIAHHAVTTDPVNHDTDTVAIRC